MYKLIPVGLALFLLACSTARVTRTNGEVVEGRIESGSGSDITMSTSQGTQRIARRDIEEIEHPGGGPMWFGGITFGLGVASAVGAAVIIGTTNDATSRVGALPFLLGSIVLLPTGAIIGGVGVASRWGSEGRAEAITGVSLSPLFLDATGRAHPGIGASWRF